MSRILLIDDDGDMMLLTARWLKRAGYEVDTASSGEEALAFLAGTKPDLILLDYAMPQMDGSATFAAIRAQDSLKSIPVLFRTGIDDGTAAEITERLHPDGVVLKSEGKAQLLKAVAEALG